MLASLADSQLAVADGKPVSRVVHVLFRYEKRRQVSEMANLELDVVAEVVDNPLGVGTPLAVSINAAVLGHAQSAPTGD